MDQNDSQDGNTNSNNITEPTEQQPKDILDTSTMNESVPNAMTHSEPELNAPKGADDIEPAAINTVETTTVDPEVEPSTVAYKPGGDPTVSATQPNTTDEAATASDDQLGPAAPIANAPSKGLRDKKMLIIAAFLGLTLLVVGLIAWWILGRNQNEVSDQTNSTLSTPLEQPKLGVALTVVDNTVDYSTNGTEWETASTDTQLEEGNYVRTSSESRAVLTLDDGSAVRLDASTQVKLSDLSADNVKIEQIEGSVYSRIVPSDRTYVVTVDETTYEALGTAFVTIKKETESGVQVYQSSVKVSDSSEDVTEGKQFYKTNSDAALEGKLTDINIDTLVESAFVNWNLSQDENDTNFKDKLGVLSQIKERSATLETERKAAEQAAKEGAARLEQEKLEAQEKEQSEQDDKVTRGTMTLGLSGKTFSWNYTGKAKHGYKLVYSKKTATPTFGSNDAVYFSSMSTTSGELPSKDKIGAGKYYVRVCAYTAGTDDEGCVDYSNVVVVTI